MKSHNTIHQDRHWHLPKSRRSSFSLRRHLSFHNCHVAETAFHEASKHLQTSKNEAPQSIAEHVVVIAPENLVKRCFLMFPEGGYSALLEAPIFRTVNKVNEVNVCRIQLENPWGCSQLLFAWGPITHQLWLLGLKVWWWLDTRKMGTSSSSCMIVIGYGSKLWYPGEHQNN